MSKHPPIGPDTPWLAPLAGFSDLPFRLLCREMGAVVACTEMVSAKGLIYSLRKDGHHGATWDLLRTTPDDTPLVVQLFGEDPDFVSQAVRILQDHGFFWFDLNMGCSVPKVCKTGAGAALLQDPERAVAVASALCNTAGSGMAGCKIRLGWDATSELYVDLARRLEQVGAAWVTLHPRFARQGFSGQADASAIRTLADAVAIPVLASGDLMEVEDGLDRLERGATGVMFARGAMANPAIFRRYHALRRGVEDPARLNAPELKQLILRHAQLAREFTSGKTGRAGIEPALLKMRTVVPRYVRRLPMVKHMRKALTQCASWEHFDRILSEFLIED